MAEHIVSSVTSAVTGEVVRALVSGIMGKLDRHGAAAAAKKLRRLDLLLIKIHSAVEASENHSIENASLIRQREADSAAAAEEEATGDTAAQQQKEQEHQSSSSSSASPAATTTATRNAPLGIMAQKNIRSATTASDEDMTERLNSAVERLEELSPEIGTFVKLLKLEVLKPEQTPSTGNRRKSEMTLRTRTNRSSRSSFAAPIDAVLVEAGMMGALPAHRRHRLLDRLVGAFAPILRSLELTHGCDMTAHVWLAHWASVLREAKEQVGAVVGAINAAHRDPGAGEEVEVVGMGCDDYREGEDSELGRFVCSLESLAGEVDCFRDLHACARRTSTYGVMIESRDIYPPEVLMIRSPLLALASRFDRRQHDLLPSCAVHVLCSVFCHSVRMLAAFLDLPCYGCRFKYTGLSGIFRAMA
ncbi:hypothetical protein BS78_06G143900 [Paspalum vaginatum]|nr:hypothetical protein BS78_06G143900 [Paspalum vaginatum]